jgi:hypothetical protein
MKIRTSVADPGCLSWIPDLESRISDPGSWIQQKHQKRRGKIFIGPIIFCSHKYHKIVNILIFEQLKKFFLANTLLLTSTFYPKICH